MLSAIVGDIIGSRFETENHRSIYFQLFDEKCRFTDDTVCTSAIASMLEKIDESPAASDGFNIINQKWAALILKVNCLRNINRGFGSMFYQWVVSGDYGSYGSFGNGALMRISPVPIWGIKNNKELGYIKELALDFTNLTHNHKRSQKAVLLYVEMLYVLLSEKLSVKNAKSKIIEILLKYDYEVPKKIEEYRLNFDFDVTCEYCIYVACASILEASSYEEVFHLAVSAGGDSDTICAVAGPIAEAIWGLDKKYIDIIKMFFKEADLNLIEPVIKLYDKN